MIELTQLDGENRLHLLLIIMKTYIKNKFGAPPSQSPLLSSNQTNANTIRWIKPYASSINNKKGIQPR